MTGAPESLIKHPKPDAARPGGPTAKTKGKAFLRPACRARAPAVCMAGVTRLLTPPQLPSGFHGGMTHSASRSATPRRTRRIVLLSLAALGVASVAFAVRRPLLMSAPRCLAGRWHG